MRTVWVILVGLSAAACTSATPVVSLRVEPQVVQRMVDTPERQAARTRIETAKKMLQQREAELARARAERSGPEVDAKTAPPALKAVLEAAEARKAAFVAWRAAQLEHARWDLASAEAQLEVLQAEQIARTGADIDPARYRAQLGRMQEGRSGATRRIAQARANCDNKERALADAKERYAASLRPAAVATTP